MFGFSSSNAAAQKQIASLKARLAAQTAAAKKSQANFSKQLALLKQAQQQQADQLQQSQQALSLVQATPETVLQQRVFNLPSYVAAFGRSPEVQSLDPLDRIFNSPMYQVAFGIGNDQRDPTQRFKFDPGYAFTQYEGMKGLQQQGAARGLLESGPMQRELLRFSQGLADQNYQRWLQQQMAMAGDIQNATTGTLTDYQNRLQQLMGLGPGVNGNATAFNAGGLFANIGANAANTYANLYQNLGSQGLGARSNLGIAGLNAYNQAGIAMGQIQQQQQSQAMQAIGSVVGAIGGRLAGGFG